MHGARLRAYDAQRDLATIFSLYMDPVEQPQFAMRVPITSEAEFAAWFEENMGTYYHDFYVIEAGPPDAAELAGFVFSYDYHAFDLHCKVCIYVTDKYRATGLAGTAGTEFIDAMFCMYPLRKVYALVYGYNQQSLKSNLAAGFVEEGVLKEYRYLDGAWHDCHMLGLTRERFYEGVGRMSGLAHPFGVAHPFGAAHPFGTAGTGA